MRKDRSGNYQAVKLTSRTKDATKSCAVPRPRPSVTELHPGEGTRGKLELHEKSVISSLTLLRAVMVATTTESRQIGQIFSQVMGSQRKKCLSKRRGGCLVSLPSPKLVSTISAAASVRDPCGLGAGQLKKRKIIPGLDVSMPWCIPRRVFRL